MSTETPQERQQQTLRKQISEKTTKEKNNNRRDTIPEYESKRECFAEEKIEIHEGMFVT